MSRRPGARHESCPPTVDAPPAATAPGRGAAVAAVSPLRRRLASRRAGVALLASVIGSTGLAACASGTDAVTTLARTTTNSVAGAVGSISLRNVYLAGPVAQGDSAQIISAFFNGGTDPDSIVAVSSPVASGGQPPSAAQLPPGSGQIFIANGSAPTLQGVKQDLPIGSQLPITFTFAKAGSVTLDVPVEPPAPGASAPTTAAASRAATRPASASPLATGTATAAPGGHHATPSPTAPGTAPTTGLPVTPTPGASPTAAGRTS